MNHFTRIYSFPARWKTEPPGISYVTFPLITPIVEARSVIVRNICKAVWVDGMGTVLMDR